MNTEVINEKLYNVFTANSSADFKVHTIEDQIYLCWREYNLEGENGGSDIYVVVKSDDTWTSPVRLTTTEGYVDGFAVGMLGGDLSAVYCRTEVTFSEDSFETVSDLCSQSIMFTDTNLEIIDIHYDPSDLFDDDNLTIDISIKNNGLLESSEFVLKWGSNTNQQIANVTVEIAPGATKKVFMEYKLQGEESIFEVVIEDGNGIVDSKKIQIGYADFSISAEQQMVGNISHLNTTVRNKNKMHKAKSLALNYL